MFKHILVPLDGSSRAEQAIPVAAHIAHASNGTLILLKVATQLVDFEVRTVQLRKHPELAQEADVARANDYLAHLASSDGLKGIDIQTEVLTGPAAETILMFAQMQRIDLVVMCSHGATGFKRWALGSVAQKVARYSPTPVLVLREGGPALFPRREDTTHPLRLLLALDGSPLAEATLVPAAQLCAALAAPARGELHLLRVLRLLPLEEEEEGEIASMNEQAMADARTYLSEVAQHLREGDLAQLDLVVKSSVVVNVDIADTLIRVGEHGDTVEKIDSCDVIAMATHGRSAPQRWIMGSIAERVLSATRQPLLIVRPQHLQAHEHTSTAETGKTEKV
jgi:nucleotide-binding universal stress UspA family protein